MDRRQRRVAACCLLLLAAPGPLASAQGMKTALWTVHLDKERAVKAAAGDLIRVVTPGLPVIPANLGVKFEITYDHQHLRLVGDEPLEGEGKLGRQYYLLVLARKESTILVRTMPRGRAATTIELRVEPGMAEEGN